MYTQCRHTCIASGMLSVVGERESVHAKLEARTYIRHYGMDSAYIYIDIIIEKIGPLTQLGWLAPARQLHVYAWNGLSKCHQLHMYVCVYALHVAGARAVMLMSLFLFVLLLHPSCGQSTCTGLLNITN